jgi:hypothetical protein
MNWDEFILLYTIIGVIILLLNHKIYKKKIKILFMVIIFINIILFLFDYIANDLNIWTFPVLWGIYFYHNPVENILFVTFTLSNLITFYNWLRNQS